MEKTRPSARLLTLLLAAFCAIALLAAYAGTASGVEGDDGGAVPPPEAAQQASAPDEGGTDAAEGPDGAAGTDDDAAPDADADAVADADLDADADADADDDIAAADSEAVDQAADDAAAPAKGHPADPEQAQREEDTGAAKGARAAKAPAQRAVHNDVITSIEAVMQDGSAPIGSVGQWEVFRLKVAFALPDGQVNGGDTTTITLPEKLRFDQTAGIDIPDENGNIVAHATIDGPAKKVTITYTDFAETHSGVKGDFYMYVKIDREMVDEEEDIKLVFDVDGNTVYGPTIHFEGIGTPTGRCLTKSGWTPSGSLNDGRTISYQLAINTLSEERIDNVVITDELQNPGLAIDPDSFKIVTGKWFVEHGDFHLDGETDVTSQYQPVISADGASFTLNLGNITEGEGFRVRYEAKANYDLADGEVIQNTAVFNGSQVEPVTVPRETTYLEAGGSAAGYVYAIRIQKTGEGGELLAGAVFDVIRASTGLTVGAITTDASGAGTVSGLLNDSYRIVEVTAPAGYALLPEPVTVDAGDFDPDSHIALVPIQNEMEKRSIPVTKTWVGPAVVDSVTIYLRAGDNRELVESIELNAGNGWQHTFTGLDRYDSEGNEIEYRISEQGEPGFGISITGDMNQGFTVRNFNQAKTDIPVTKEWAGAEGLPVTVNLLADGQKVDSAVLSADNSWKHTFEGMRVYSIGDGHEIAYSVEEDPVAGYAASYAGSAAGGFTVTNTPVPVPPAPPETTSVQVAKEWAGEIAGPVTVRLMADGAEVASARLDADGGWKHTFAGLPKLNAEGGEIAYSVEEDPVAGYAASYAGSAARGFTVTNTPVPVPPAPPETTSVQVAKEWAGEIAGPVTVRLMADGAEVASARLDADGGWKHTFADLPKLNADGAEIEYMVAEDAVAGYDVGMSGSAAEGFTITNTERGKSPSPEPKEKAKASPTSKAKAAVPASATAKTGDDALPLIGVAAVALIALAIASAIFFNRRRRAGTGGKHASR